LAAILIEIGRPDQAVRVVTRIENVRRKARTLAAIALVTGGEDENTFMNAVCEIMMSPYARENLAALPVSVIERLADEGQLG
jgi:hypothetical protein